MKQNHKDAQSLIYFIMIAPEKNSGGVMFLTDKMISVRSLDYPLQTPLTIWDNAAQIVSVMLHHRLY